MFELTIQPTQSSSCVDVPIINDDVNENDIEGFEIILTPPAGIPAPSSLSTIRIIDEDCEYCSSRIIMKHSRRHASSKDDS